MHECRICGGERSVEDSEGGLTQLLTNGTGDEYFYLCRRCRVQQIASKQGPALQPVHIVNELITPEVDYGSWAEFATLVYDVQDHYCAALDACMHKALSDHLRTQNGPQLFLHDIDLSELRELGPSIVMRLTKQTGVFWCKMVAYFVYTRALRALAIYKNIFYTAHESDLLRSWTLEDTVDRVVAVMQTEVRATFSGAMPFSIYTLCSGFISTLLVRNFTFYNDSDLTAFTRTQFQDILLALCMGLHPRVGARSPLFALTDDVLQSVCADLAASQLMKHIVFHTQEQWLVA